MRRCLEASPCKKSAIRKKFGSIERVLFQAHDSLGCRGQWLRGGLDNLADSDSLPNSSLAIFLYFQIKIASCIVAGTDSPKIAGCQLYDAYINLLLFYCSD